MEKYRSSNAKIVCLVAFCILLHALISIAVAQSPIPESQRSRLAIERVTPRLDKELTKSGLKLGAPIFIRIFKEEMALEIWMKKKKRFQLFKSYPICTFGSEGLGPKIRQGDGRAPEGFYFVRPNQLNPSSLYHLSFNLGYPNRYDRSHNRTGGALMVHGDCVSVGCYAMKDWAIEEIYALADEAFRNGQPFFRVHVFPFHMTDTNMKGHSKSKWYRFWKNLKEGYDFFEIKNFNPPNVLVRNSRYVFEKI